MTPDTFTEVTKTSWFGRMGRSFKGILVGVILIGVSFPVLWINEGRAVRRAKALEEGEKLVVPIQATDTQPEWEGKLVHLSGRAETDEELSDPDFMVKAKALRLLRRVQMYQWEERESRETRKKLGGGEETVTTYSYEKTWSSDLERSGQFKHPSGHENPDRMPFDRHEEQATLVRLGGYQLSAGQVGRIDADEPLRVDSALLGSLPESLRGRLQVNAEGELYLGANPSNPQIGDLRISFSQVPPVDVSIVARRIGNSFEPYLAKTGPVDLLQTGLHSAEAMFAAAKQQNAILTWILRGVGFLLMMIGLRLLLEPLGVFADVVPLLGNILRLGTGLFSFVVALTLSVITIAIAWFAYRPLLGGGLLAGALVIAFLASRRGSAKAAPVPAAPGGMAPPPPPPPA